VENLLHPGVALRAWGERVGDDSPELFRGVALRAWGELRVIMVENLLHPGVALRAWGEPAM